MPQPTEQPVVLDAPAADGADDWAEETPPGQIEHPDVPTPADAIDQDQPEDTPAAVAENDDPHVAPGYPSTILPPGAYFEVE